MTCNGRAPIFLRADPEMMQELLVGIAARASHHNAPKARGPTSQDNPWPLCSRAMSSSVPQEPYLPLTI